MIIYTRTVQTFQVAWPLPVYQMATHRHFYEDFMTFVFDKSFFKAMELNSKRFNKPFVVI